MLFGQTIKPHAGITVRCLSLVLCIVILTSSPTFAAWGDTERSHDGIQHHQLASNSSVILLSFLQDTTELGQATSDAEITSGVKQGVSGSETESPQTKSGEKENAAASQSTGSGAKNSRAAMLVGSLTVFLLAVFVGFEVITKVPPTLHTPLMSGSNAISGITIVGAMLTAGAAGLGLGSWLGMVAVVLAAINVVGGFLVTHRMLMMFKKK